MVWENHEYTMTWESGAKTHYDVRKSWTQDYLIKQNRKKTNTIWYEKSMGTIWHEKKKEHTMIWEKTWTQYDMRIEKGQSKNIIWYEKSMNTIWYEKSNKKEHNMIW